MKLSPLLFPTIHVCKLLRYLYTSWLIDSFFVLPVDSRITITVALLIWPGLYAQFLIHRTPEMLDATVLVDDNSIVAPGFPRLAHCRRQRRQVTKRFRIQQVYGE